MGLVLGLMGWFGSGKTTAAKFFKKKDFLEIDVDEIGKDALIEKKDELVTQFGESILEEGEISPFKLGNIVFKDEVQLEKLNEIVHPWMVNKVKKVIKNNADKNILVNAAILPQLGLKRVCGKVLMIDAKPEVIVKRGMERNDFSEEKVLKILEMQKANNDYFGVAHVIIDNSSTLEHFEEHLNSFYDKLNL